MFAEFKGGGAGSAPSKYAPAPAFDPPLGDQNIAIRFGTEKLESCSRWWKKFEDIKIDSF